MAGREEKKTDAVVEKLSVEANENEGLVKMHKKGETIHVHPTTVEAHIEAGWESA